MTFQSIQSQRTKGIYKSINKYILPDFNCIVRGVYSFKIIILIMKSFLCAIITILQLENTQGVKSLIIKKTVPTYSIAQAVCLAFLAFN